MGKKASTNTGLLAVILIALVVLGLGSYTGWKFNLGTTTPPPSGAGTATGTFTMNVVGYDSLSPSTQVTWCASTMAVRYFGYRNGWVQIGSYSAAGSNVEIITADLGYAYIVVDGNATYYIDSAKTQTMNSRIKAVTYEDVDNTGTKEWVFKYDMSNIPVAASGYPSSTMYLYLLLAEASPTQTLTANLTSVGTSKVTKYLEYYATLAASQKALAVYKVVLKVNRTDTSYYTLNKVNIPSVGYVDGSSFDQSILENYVQYTYTIGTDLHSCVYWQLPTNVLNKFSETTSIDFTLPSAGYGLTWQLIVYTLSGLDASGTMTVTAYVTG